MDPGLWGGDGGLRSGSNDQWTPGAPKITCKDLSGNETHFTGKEVGFLKPISCRNVNGLLKFCTIVGPSDGSSYIIDYYGARLTRLSITNETFRKTQLYP
ncbi:TM2 domain-containing protein 1 [Apodemus speciosus]|uniref:TM2 domain-containing protein 1 n=1 Tax=Apodemus speciosus TaxID=105296 RepID=A0ABQ0ENK6_APOSI